MATKVAICVLACVAWAPLAIAQESDATTLPDSALAPTGKEVDIRQLIATVSAKTHKKFVVDPRVRAEVSMIGFRAADVSYPLLLTILAVHGFTSYEQDGVVVVMPEANARQAPTAVMPGSAIRGADAELITVVRLLKNHSAAQLVPVLRPLMPQQAQLSQVTGTNGLIISDRAANVRRILAIVDEVEKLPVNGVPPEGKAD